MNHQRLGHDFFHAHARVERGEGVLKDDLHIAAKMAKLAAEEASTTFWPLKLMPPEVGSMRRRIMRPSVVFPQPDSPTRPSVSPWVMSSETPLTARTSRLVCRTSVVSLVDLDEVADGEQGHEDNIADSQRCQTKLCWIVVSAAGEDRGSARIS